MKTQLKKQYHTVFVTLGAKPCHNALYYFKVEMFCFILEVFTKHTKTCIIYKINTLKICLAYFCINLKDESTYLNMIWMYLLKFSKIQRFTNAIQKFNSLILLRQYLKCIRHDSFQFKCYLFLYLHCAFYERPNEMEYNLAQSYKILDRL